MNTIEGTSEPDEPWFGPAGPPFGSALGLLPLALPRQLGRDRFGLGQNRVNPALLQPDRQLHVVTPADVLPRGRIVPGLRPEWLLFAAVIGQVTQFSTVTGMPQGAAYPCAGKGQHSLKLRVFRGLRNQSPA